eukprot:scaffold264524_cov23-Tisochrysis_lutea.AAC.2
MEAAERRNAGSHGAGMGSKILQLQPSLVGGPKPEVVCNSFNAAAAEFRRCAASDCVYCLAAVVSKVQSVEVIYTHSSIEHRAQPPS